VLNRCSQGGGYSIFLMNAMANSVVSLQGSGNVNAHQCSSERSGHMCLAAQVWLPDGFVQGVWSTRAGV
jgi:hypothetical protein